MRLIFFSKAIPMSAAPFFAQGIMKGSYPSGVYMYICGFIFPLRPVVIS